MTLPAYDLAEILCRQSGYVGTRRELRSQIEAVVLELTAAQPEVLPSCFPKPDRDRGHSTFAHFRIDPIQETIDRERGGKQHRRDPGARHWKGSYN